MTLERIDTQSGDIVLSEPTPVEKVAQAKEWSTALMGVVNNAKDAKGEKTMVSNISGNEFLKLEAWDLIGSFAISGQRLNGQSLLSSMIR